jgi:hypothetical protein
MYVQYTHPRTHAHTVYHKYKEWGGCTNATSNSGTVKLGDSNRKTQSTLILYRNNKTHDKILASYPSILHTVLGKWMVWLRFWYWEQTADGQRNITGCTQWRGILQASSHESNFYSWCEAMWLPIPDFLMVDTAICQLPFYNTIPDVSQFIARNTLLGGKPSWGDGLV